jgi:hypothetical protein
MMSWLITLESGSWKSRDRNRSAGLAVFTLGAVLMALGSLLPWFLYPLYIRYGWTEGFVEHIWPQTMVGNTPLLVLVWIMALSHVKGVGPREVSDMALENAICAH